jgi:hypothetical protein
LLQGLPGAGHLRGHGTIPSTKGGKKLYLEWPQAAMVNTVYTWKIPENGGLYSGNTCKKNIKHDYPLVNSAKKPWNITMLLMGKLTKTRLGHVQ